MTLEERIDAGAAELSWSKLGGSEAAIQAAKRVLVAAYPELFVDRTHWLAPMEADEGMLDAAAGPPPPHGNEMLREHIRLYWQEARDHSLGRGKP